MSDKNIKDDLISIWRHKTTGEFLVAMRVGVMQKLIDDKYVDKNGDEWTLFNPLETTCQLGRLEIKSTYSYEFEKDMKSLNISTGTVLNFRDALIEGNKNIDEYGNKMRLDNVFTMLYKFGITNDNDGDFRLVNKNFNFSYVGTEDRDVYGTNANDFWRQYFEKICSTDDSKYMLFYKHMNLPFKWDGGVLLALNTSLSRGHIESLRKQIADKGHFVGCDGYIYNFNEFYSPEAVVLYKKYIDFILNGKLPEKSNNNKLDYAEEIIKHVCNLDTKFKGFIEKNKLKYNINNGRFEMNFGDYRCDATAWLYSRFFAKLDKNCTKYQFMSYKNKKLDVKERICDFDDYGKLIGNENMESIAYRIIEDVPNDPENFYFIKNVAEYLEKSLTNLDFIDEKTASEFKKIINSGSQTGINKFFSKPEKIKAMMLGQQKHSISCGLGSHDIFQACLVCVGKKTELESILSKNGNKLLELIQKGLAGKKYVCKTDEFEKFLLSAVARSLFDTFQLGGDYNNFVDRLRIYVSPMFNENAHKVLAKTFGLTHDKSLVLFDPVTLNKPFYGFTTEISKINNEITALRAKCCSKDEQIKKIFLSLEDHKNKEPKEELEKKVKTLTDEKKHIWLQIQDRQKVLESKQKEMDSMFLTKKDFDFLQEYEDPIINENDFEQTANNKLLDVLKKKIYKTNIKKFVKSKFNLSNNDDKLQQHEKDIKADLYESIVKKVKDYGQALDYDDLLFFIEASIRERFDDELNKTIFDMISNFKKELKYKGYKLVNNYKENMSVMKVYHFIQHIFNAVGHLAFEKCSIKGMQMIIFNREEMIFHLKKNPSKIFQIQGKSVFDSLVIHLIQGTSLEKNNLDENIAWIRIMVLSLDEKTVDAKEISQFSIAAFNDENRRIKNGFFSNSRKGNIIQIFFIPVQALEEQIEDEECKIWTKIIKPRLGSKIKLVDVNSKCDLILNKKWKRITVKEMLEYSKNATYEELNKINFIDSEDEKDGEDKNNIINECFISSNNHRPESEIKTNLNENEINISCGRQNLDNCITNNDNTEKPKVKLITNMINNTFEKKNVHKDKHNSIFDNHAFSCFRFMYGKFCGESGINSASNIENPDDDHRNTLQNLPEQPKQKGQSSKNNVSAEK